MESHTQEPEHRRQTHLMPRHRMQPAAGQLGPHAVIGEQADLLGASQLHHQVEEFGLKEDVKQLFHVKLLSEQRRHLRVVKVLLQQDQAFGKGLLSVELRLGQMALFKQVLCKLQGDPPAGDGGGGCVR